MGKCDIWLDLCFAKSHNRDGWLVWRSTIFPVTLATRRGNAMNCDPPRDAEPTSPRSGSHGLGRLEDVSLRLVWRHETQAFTPWLAANIDQLGEAVGMPLQPMGTEVQLDGLPADILARNLRDGSIVLIEAQLEPADPCHLGQILAYQAGLDAKTVIWIAAGFKPPYLAAIRWLNARTSPSHGFFAVRLRALRIGASAVAPAFEVLERPERPSATFRRAAQKGPAKSEPAGPLRAFWSAFLTKYPDEAARSRQLGETCRWRTLGDLVVGQQVQDRRVRVFMRGRQGVALKTAIDRLAPHRQALEGQLGASLTIEDGCLAVKALEIDTHDPANWDAMADWLRTQSDAYEAFLRSAVGSPRLDGKRKKRRSALRDPQAPLSLVASDTIPHPLKQKRGI